MNTALLLRDSSFAALKRYVLDHTGLGFFENKDEDLATRLARRLTARNIAAAADYLQLLDREHAEMDALVGELTIGETYFFRQAGHFEILRNRILPVLLERNKLARRIRIWSAGCATGAEPYSISLLLALEFEPKLAGWDVSIVATDINIDFLARARERRYANWAMREVPDEIKKRCFRQDGKEWLLLPEFARRVSFQYHNLASNMTPVTDGSLFDLILCRNVLIYFSPETMHSLARRLFDSLNPGGWLLVGHAEPNQEIFGMFETETVESGTIYRKGDTPSSVPPLPAAVEFCPVDWLREKVPVSAPAPLPDREAAAHAAPTKVEPLPVDEVRILADSGAWDQALNAANELIRQDPLNAPAQFTLGLILEHAGDHQAAQLALRRAIYLDRGFALAHYHLGTSLASAGDSPSAARAFSTVLRLTGSTAPGEPLAHGDGITARELADLATMHLEMIAR